MTIFWSLSVAEVLHSKKREEDSDKTTNLLYTNHGDNPFVQVVSPLAHHYQNVLSASTTNQVVCSYSELGKRSEVRIR